MQVYAGLPILTNQPGAEARAGEVPPRRLGVAAGRVHRRRVRARGARRSSTACSRPAGRVVVEGGSGLYLRAALGDLAFGAAPDAARRRELEERWERATRGARGRAAPARAGRGGARRPRNPRRVIRALEALDRRRERAHAQTGELWSAGGRYAHRLVALVPDDDRAALKAAHRAARRRDARRRRPRRGRRGARGRPLLAHGRRRRSACASSAPSSTASSRSTRPRRA